MNHKLRAKFFLMTLMCTLGSKNLNDFLDVSFWLELVVVDQLDLAVFGDDIGLTARQKTE